MDHDDRAPLVAQAAEQLEQRHLGARVDPGKRLVHQQQRRLLGQGARDEHPLALAPGELADLTAGEGRQPHALQALRHDAPVLLAHPPQPAHRCVAAHLDDLPHGDREVPVDGVALRHVGHAVQRRLRGPPVDGHLPGVDGHQAQARLQQRRLARTVGADDRAHPPGGERRVDVPEDGLGGVGRREALDLQGGDRLVHLRPSTIRSTFALTIPTYVPSGVPAMPAESA